VPTKAHKKDVKGLKSKAKHARKNRISRTTSKRQVEKEIAVAPFEKNKGGGKKKSVWKQ